MTHAARHMTWDWTQVTVPLELDGRPVTELLDGRYALLDPLGSGAQGRVLTAQDLHTRTPVAIKLMPLLSSDLQDRARQEILALRLLDSPYVVHFLDEGRTQDWVYLVMELVQGEPLPKGPLPWSQVRELAIGILQALETVHQQGVVHRDLKPENVLLREGLPVLLDFGLAQGAVLHSAHRQRLEGTPRYASPEQFQGTRSDHRSDLYALGVMLFEMLTGDSPHRGNVLEIQHARLRYPAPDLRERVQGLPELAYDLVNALLERDPEERPQSASALLPALGAPTLFERVERLLAHLPTRCRAKDIEHLFWGQRRFLHIPRDAAIELYARTGGFKEPLVAVLTDWLQQGRATLDQGQIRMSRMEIQRLRYADPYQSRDLATVEALLKRCELVIDHQADNRQGLEWARQAADIAMDLGALDRARAALEWMTAARLALSTVSGVSETLVELERAHRRGVAVDDLVWLVRGQQQLSFGEWERGRESIEKCPPVNNEVLEQLRRGQLLRSFTGDAQALQGMLYSPEFESWAHTRRRKGALFTWRANLLSTTGDFKGAMHMALRGAEHRDKLHRQNSSLLSAVNSGVECQHYEMVERMLPQIERQARYRRNAAQQLRVKVIYRIADVRIGLVNHPTPALAYDAELIRPVSAAATAIIEGGLAWRVGDLKLGLELAQFGLRVAERCNHKGAQLMLRGLIGLCGGPSDPEALLADLRAWPIIPEGRAQVLALIAVARGRPSPDLLAELKAISYGHPQVRSQRRDLWSLSQCEYACRTGQATKKVHYI